jgi:hypothetical protein
LKARRTPEEKCSPGSGAGTGEERDLFATSGLPHFAVGAFDLQVSRATSNCCGRTVIAGKNQPSMSLMNQPDKLQHLPPAKPNLTIMAMLYLANLPSFMLHNTIENTRMF